MIHVEALTKDFGDSPDPLAGYLQDEWGIALGKDMVVDLTSNQPFVAYAYQYGDHLMTENLEGEDIIGMVPLAVAAVNSLNGSRVVVIGDSEFASNAFLHNMAIGTSCISHSHNIGAWSAT